MNYAKRGIIKKEDFNEKYAGLVDLLGIGKAVRLSEVYGGKRFIVPSLKKFFKDEVYADVISDYRNGMNVSELVRKYEFSPDAVCSIIGKIIIH